MITLQDIKNNLEVQELIKSSQKGLNALGYTEHSSRHISIVSNRAGKVLESLERPCEYPLARASSYIFWKSGCYKIASEVIPNALKEALFLIILSKLLANKSCYYPTLLNSFVISSDKIFDKLFD